MIPSEPAPSDEPAALQAMLAAERAENERLRKIIRELQCHRFGRRIRPFTSRNDEAHSSSVVSIDATNSCRLPTLNQVGGQAKTATVVLSLRRRREVVW